MSFNGIITETFTDLGLDTIKTICCDKCLENNNCAGKVCNDLVTLIFNILSKFSTKFTTKMSRSGHFFTTTIEMSRIGTFWY